jgi:1,4-dihydroxy-2-naphthoyl-CoA synthase
MASCEDLEYAVDGSTALVTVNRPEHCNALRGKTVQE